MPFHANLKKPPEFRWLTVLLPDRSSNMHEYYTTRKTKSKEFFCKLAIFIVLYRKIRVGAKTFNSEFRRTKKVQNY